MLNNKTMIIYTDYYRRLTPQELYQLLVKVYPQSLDFDYYKETNRRNNPGISLKSNLLSMFTGSQAVGLGLIEIGNPAPICDNTNHRPNKSQVKQVEMLEVFEGGWFNWCENCIKRDGDMVKNIK